MYPHPEQVIHQVFTAAVNLAGLGPLKSGVCALIPDVDVKALARFILKAAYRGTILAASENADLTPPEFPGRRKLFLTLVGGGVFANEMPWIVDAILDNIELIQATGLQVTLVCFNRCVSLLTPGKS